MREVRTRCCGWPGRVRAGSLRSSRWPLAVALLVTTLTACTQDASSHSADKKKPSKPDHLVELATVRSDALRTTSVYTGSLGYRRSVRVFNQEEGRLVSFAFFEGDRVAEGAVLFELDGSLLEAELDKARAVRREAAANVERTRRLRRQGLTSDEEHLRARTALEVSRAEERMLETRLGYTRGKAPFAGLVTARMVEPGDIVPRHTHLLTLVDPASLVTDLQVSELIIPHLERGEEVVVRIDALSDTVFNGRVLRVHPQLNARTRQGRVEVALDPVPEGARAGLFTRVAFNVESLATKVMPFSALRRDRAGEYVFRVEDDNKVKRVAVRGGRRQADRVEVLDGLEVGDRVVTRGFLGLGEGKVVTQVAPRGESGRG